MKEYYPSEEEFKDPLKYIQFLYDEGADEFGCIKIIPPESFQPEFSFDLNGDVKLPSRK